MQKWLFFKFNWVWDMGCAKWPHGSREYFYYWGRPYPTLIYRDIDPFVGPKILKFLILRVWNMGCPIEWAHVGDHFWYSDRLVSSAISWSNRAIRPWSFGKSSLILFQIPSLAQGRINWDPAPQWAACGSWGVGEQFFRPSVPSCQSHSDLKKRGAI